MTARPAAAVRTAGWVLLLAHAAVVAALAWHRPPTVDEPGHIVSGLYAIRTGRFDLYPVNPPPVKMLAALPVHLLDTNWDFSGIDARPGVRTEWTVGHRWLEINERHPIPAAVQLYLCRLTMLPWAVLGGWVCRRWAGELYGPAGGLVACGLWCCSPLVISNAAVVANDVPGAAAGLLAAWRLWHFLRRPDGFNVLLYGLTLGLALLCKHTWVIAFGVWPLTAALWRASFSVRPPADPAGRPAPWGTLAGGTAAALAISLLVLNAGYNFAGTFTPLGDYRFVSQALTGGGHEQFHRVGANRFAGTAVGRAPLPVPADWVRGIDLQRVDLEEPKPALVDGVKWDRPRWWGYFYYWAVDTPFCTWPLLVLAGGGTWRDVRSRRPARCADGDPPVAGITAGDRLRGGALALAVGAAALAAVSANAHLLFFPRYALPAWALLCVWAGRAAGGGRRRRTAAAGLTVGLWCEAAAEVLDFF